MRKTRFAAALAAAALATAALAGTASAAPSSLESASVRAEENIVHVTDANYNQVMETSKQKLVIMDFGATWCPPCQKMKPVIEKMARESGGKWLLAEVDADESKAILTKHNVKYLPTLQGIRNAADLPDSRRIGYGGANAERDLKNWINAQLAKG
ncbi:thioredoxin family protein [Crossiella sp. SN42]|uniref:thioredoxin family protein n=1 Tax=Crossiella sp. SN42 TaxID=2944808 RepID=UPI00207C8396|nr:thioredoxin family protein [Crossiella sp. SN42]MCO1578343.1 thioredoxin family protein [Crossiella sp. SN42]